jgi:AcrR family transcriptional regulator
MSQGNLHYHYPNKDALIQELFKVFMQKLVDESHYVPNQNFPKEVVLASIQENFKLMYSYRFFFIDAAVVSRRLPLIKEKLEHLFDQKRADILRIIEKYRADDIFRKDVSDEQVEYLADQFVFSFSSWLTASAYIKPKGDIVTYFSRFIFRMWLPYLTVSEMPKWEKLL